MRTGAIQETTIRFHRCDRSLLGRKNVRPAALERPHEERERSYGEAGVARFDFLHHTWVKVRSFGQFLLRELPRAANPLHVLPDMGEDGLMRLRGAARHIPVCPVSRLTTT